MNIETFKKLNTLVDKRNRYEENIKLLNDNKGRLNHIGLFKDIYKIYFDDELLPIIANYYKNKIYELDKQLEKFTVLEKM